MNSDNPAAFPMKQTLGPDNEGMSLRDYFAAHAMQALVTSHAFGGELKRIYDSDQRIANTGDDKESPQEYLARVACSIADAMLKERAK